MYIPWSLVTFPVLLFPRYWFFRGIILLSSIWAPPLCLKWVPMEGRRLSKTAPLKPHIPWFAVILPPKGLLPWDPQPRRNQLSQVSRTPFHPFPAGLCFKEMPLWSAVKGVTRLHWIIAAQDLDSRDCYNYKKKKAFSCFKPIIKKKIWNITLKKRTCEIN